jgi:hypothetical protein
MQQWLVVAPGAAVVSPVETTPSLGFSRVSIERILDLVEARLVELPPQALLAEPQGQELHEIRRLLATLASDLLGEGHPFVSAITRATAH